MEICSWTPTPFFVDPVLNNFSRILNNSDLGDFWICLIWGIFGFCAHCLWGGVGRCFPSKGPLKELLVIIVKVHCASRMFKNPPLLLGRALRDEEA